VAWLEVIKGLGLTGTGALMAIAIWKLWTKLEAKDAEIARLNAERTLQRPP
jgi:hypothetical protein